jgi:hypothetical protein
MFLYIIVVLLVLNIIFFFTAPRTRANRIKRADKELVKRFLTGSNGYPKQNLEVRKVLIGEGHSQKEVDAALIASALERNGDKSSIGPIMGIITCIFLIIEILIPKYFPGNVTLSTALSFVFLALITYLFYSRKSPKAQ